MAAGHFGDALRDDRSRGKPQVPTVSGMLADKAATLANRAGLLAVCAMVVAIASAAWNIYKDTLPPVVLTAIVDRSGYLVRTEFASQDSEMQNLTVNALLGQVMWNSRTITPDMPIAAQMRDFTKAFFVDMGAAKMTRHLENTDATAKLVREGAHRLVVPGSVYARQIEAPGGEKNGPRWHRVTWSEQLFSRQGRPQGDPVQQTFEAQVVFGLKLPDEFAKINPWGVGVSSFSWTVRD